jgi:hypothetical protein
MSAEVFGSCHSRAIACKQNGDKRSAPLNQREKSSAMPDNEATPGCISRKG